MTIEELKNKHSKLLNVGSFKDTKWKETADLELKESVNLSIEFAISVLENMDIQHCQECYGNKIVEDKIQELKSYLDEKS
jgi:hypothetical protein